MKWIASIGVAVLLLFATACGGSGQQVANCIDPKTQDVVPASYCESGRSGGGGNGTLTGSTLTDFFLYSWMFGGHSYYPMGYHMSPQVINHYHMTTTPSANKSYKTPTGGAVKTDKSGKVDTAKSTVGTKTQTVTKNAAKSAEKVTTKTAKPSKPSTSKPSTSKPSTTKPSAPSKSSPSRSAPSRSAPSRSAPSRGR